LARRVEGGKSGGMSRTAIASLAGLAGFLAYVVIVLLLADLLRGRHWLLELAFFALAGILWVWPAKRLIAWAVRGPAGGGGG
jgi:hypothetical protein